MFCYNNVLMFSPMGGKERTSVYLVGWENAWDWMPFWKDWGPTSVSYTHLTLPTNREV